MSESFKLDIAFFCQGMSFDGRPIADKSLGGSESAAWFMSRELARLGNRVTLYCVCDKPGTYDNVEYRDVQTLYATAPRQQFDLFIVSRAYQALGLPLRASLRWLWCHDVPTEPSAEFIAFFGAFSDQVMPVSAYQAALIRALKPPAHRQQDWNERLDQILWPTRNGVDLSLLRHHAQGITRNPKRMIYASRPERGLDFLLMEVWPKLRAIDPALELVVCGYDSSKIPQVNRELAAYYERLDQLMEQTEGITNLGALTKAGFAKALKSSTLMLYPTRFPEVGFIAGMEAMALGVPVITTHDFALPEAIPYGGIDVLDHRLPHDPLYTRAFVDRTVEVLANEFERARLIRMGEAHVEEHHQWKDIALEWEARAYAQLEERVRTKGHRICEGLIYNSAIVAAHEMAKAEHYEDLEKQSADYLLHHHEDPDDYFIKDAAQRTGWEARTGRWAQMARHLPPPGPGMRRVLDVGCGAGGLMGHVLKYREEDLHVHGVDFSPALVGNANAFLDEQGWSERASCWIADATTDFNPMAVHRGHRDYDAIFAGEILEHQLDPTAFIDGLEARVRNGGRVILSVPSGPWESLSYGTTPSLATVRHHIQDFKYRDLRELFGAKEDLKLEFMLHQVTPRNEIIGWWVVSYTKRPNHATGTLNYRRRWMTERPFQRIALCMIVKDAANDIRKCLQSVVGVVDEIHICVDKNTTDTTRDILKEFAGQYWPRLVISEHPGIGVGEGEIGFGEARNLSLEGVDAEWVLTLDADERMSKALFLRRYLESSFFNGYSIPQNQLVIDQARKVEPEYPVRLFRADRGYRWWGKLHEDPGVELNVNIEPVYRLHESQIAHYGYEDEEIRRAKAVRRNLPLLNQDRREHPERLKGPFLVMRDYLNLAMWRAERNSGELDGKALAHIRNGCMLYLERYADAKAPWHDDAFRIYQDALRWLASKGLEVQPGWALPFEMAWVAEYSRSPLGLGRVEREPERRWFAHRGEVKDYMARAGILMYERLDPLAGVRQRHTVLPDATATSVATGQANGAALFAPGSSRIPAGEECPGDALAGAAAQASD